MIATSKRFSVAGAVLALATVFVLSGCEDKEAKILDHAADPTTCLAQATAAATPYPDGFAADWPWPDDSVVYNVEDRGTEVRITIPDTQRVGHEAHFAQVTTSFLKYLRDRRVLPAWERPNMFAKYYVTTHGTELSRQSPPRPAPRIAPQ